MSIAGSIVILVFPLLSTEHSGSKAHAFLLI